MSPSLAHAAPCPFCGGHDLDLEDWIDDERGEFNAVYCVGCGGAAPFDIWNQRVIGDGSGAQRDGGADMSGHSPGLK